MRIANNLPAIAPPSSSVIFTGRPARWSFS